MKQPKIMKIAQIIILSYILSFILIGCSVDTPLFDWHPSTQKILVERPPTRVIYTGKLDPESRKFINSCIRDMNRYPYKDYQFNPSTTFSDSLSIQRSETLQKSD